MPSIQQATASPTRRPDMRESRIAGTIRARTPETAPAGGETAGSRKPSTFRFPAPDGRPEINTLMRFYELYEADPLDRESQLFDRPHRSGTRRPTVSLKHVHRLKRMRLARRDERAQKTALWGLMYGQDEPAHRELERREAELDAREREQHLREVEADIHKAIADTETDAESKRHLHAMAMREINRRKKTM